LPFIRGLGRQCQCCRAWSIHTQYHRWLLVSGDACTAQEKMSRRSKVVVVREFADQLQEASTSSNKTAIPTRQASSERRLQCTNTTNRQYLNNHASGPFQIEDGACKHWYLIHLLFRLSIHGLCSSVHNCGRNRCSRESPAVKPLCSIPGDTLPGR
jgi:hypothetical protein